MLKVVRRDPHVLGYAQSRWTLKAMLNCFQWLRLKTLGGMSSLLKRLGISYKRGRDYVHSPDRFYEQKLSDMALALLRAWYDPQHYVFLYLDELSYYRQPSLACDWEAQGTSQALARRSHKSNTCGRIIGALNAITGQLTYEQRSHIDVTGLSKFYQQVRADYPHAVQIYIAQDNWPVHFHPNVLAQLQSPDLPYHPKLPPNWPTSPSPNLESAKLPIRFLCLPTYASWLNPIEKLWRWLKQQLLHLHRFSDDWPQLKHQVAVFLNQFRHGSLDLLRYVGLLPD
ncbi:IS630 family transposase [Nostoc sp. B(2019)]|nr:IS630 family transposase [Nostoc sp. B(2019)]